MRTQTIDFRAFRGQFHLGRNCFVSSAIWIIIGDGHGIVLRFHRNRFFVLVAKNNIQILRRFRGAVIALCNFFFIEPFEVERGSLACRLYGMEIESQAFRIAILAVCQRQRQFICAVLDIRQRIRLPFPACCAACVLAAPAIADMIFSRFQTLRRNREAAGQRDRLPNLYRHGQTAFRIRRGRKRGVVSRAGYTNTGNRMTGNIHVIERVLLLGFIKIAPNPLPFHVTFVREIEIIILRV